METTVPQDWVAPAAAARFFADRLRQTPNRYLMMADQAPVLNLIDEVYDAALDPSRWPSVLAELARSVDGVCTDFYIMNAGEVVYASLGGLPNDALSEYLEIYHGTDKAIRSIILPRSPEGSIITDREFITPQEMSKSDFYEDFLRRWDIRQFIGINALSSGPDNGFFGIQLPRKADSPSKSEISLLKPLMPHLKRAVQLHIRMASLDTKERRLAESIDNLSLGVVLLDARGNIETMNRAAEQIIAAGNGLGVSQKRLCAAHSEEDRRLTRVVGAATASNGSNKIAGGAMLVHGPNRMRPLSLIITPLSSARRSWEGLGAVVFISDPEASTSPSLEETLRELYQLTPGEARMAAALVQGMSVKEYAETAAITENTARWLLKQVFAKTDARTQTDLVRLIVRGPAALRSN